MIYHINYNHNHYICYRLKEISDIVGLSITAVWRTLHNTYNARHKFEGYIEE